MDKITVEAVENKIKEACDMFGLYTYNDKGASEVMEVKPLVKQIMALSDGNAVPVIEFLEKLEKSDRCDAGPFITEFFMHAQYMSGPVIDELFESDLSCRHH